MPTRYFCTYFDVNYLPRALALHESLVRHVGDFRLFALCHDAAVHEALERLGLQTVVPVSIAELEAHDAELAAVKLSRNRVEYYFTCTASFCRFVFDRAPEVELLTYLDADLYFFSSPDPVYAELEGHSVGIIEHRFSRFVRGYRRFGTYNVGWVSFRRDDDGLACLAWWRERCIEWCYDRVEADRYADQKYLDAFPDLFKGVRSVRHKGANVAPWNAGNYRFGVAGGGAGDAAGAGVAAGAGIAAGAGVAAGRGVAAGANDSGGANDSAGAGLSAGATVTVDDEPLIFFHFAAFKEVRPWLYRTDFGAYLTPLGLTLRRHVVRPYIAALKRFTTGATSAGRIRNTDSALGRLARWPKTAVRVLRRLVCLEYVVYRDPSA